MNIVPGDALKTGIPKEAYWVRGNSESYGLRVILTWPQIGCRESPHNVLFEQVVQRTLAHLVSNNTIVPLEQRWCYLIRILSLQWRHNGRDGVLNQQPSLTIVYSNVYSGADQRKHQSSASLAFVNSLVTGEFPAQKASNAEDASIWLRYHGFELITCYHKMQLKIEKNIVASALTHWGRVTHICVSKLTIICRCQVITWNNAGIMLFRNFCEILSEIHSSSFKNMHLKCLLQNGVYFASASMSWLVVVVMHVCFLE